MTRGLRSGKSSASMPAPIAVGVSVRRGVLPPASPLLTGTSSGASGMPAAECAEPCLSPRLREREDEAFDGRREALPLPGAPFPSAVPLLLADEGGSIDMDGDGRSGCGGIVDIADPGGPDIDEEEDRGGAMEPGGGMAEEY